MEIWTPDTGGRRPDTGVRKSESGGRRPKEGNAGTGNRRRETKTRRPEGGDCARRDYSVQFVVPVCHRVSIGNAGSGRPRITGFRPPVSRLRFPVSALRFPLPVSAAGLELRVCASFRCGSCAMCGSASHGRFCPDDIRWRVSSFPGSAPHRQIHPPLVRGKPGGLDDLHVVFPGVAVGRLRVCAHDQP